MPLNKTAALRSRLCGALVALTVAGSANPAMALTPELEAEVRYQMECFFLIFTDPAAHVELCNPQAITPGYVPVTAVGAVQVPPPPVTTTITPPVTTTPPPKTEPDSEQCGDCPPPA